MNAKDASGAPHHTFLRVKSAVSADGERWITAWATTPDTDLVGDVVSPAGAQYKLPIPLLAYHKHDSPVGVVTEAHVSDHGIRVRAKLTRGVQLADELWQLLKDGAVAAVSIGFKPLKTSPLKNGGVLFEVWRWLELSLTPVPANPAATVISVGKGLAYATRTEPTAAPPRYAPVPHDLTRDFAAAAKSLQPALAARADDRTSTRAGGRWTLRDAAGAELATVPPVLPATQPKRAPAAAKSGVTIKAFETVLAKFAELVAGKFKAANGRISALERTAAIDNELLDALTDMSRRLDALEERAPADTATRGVRWCGKWSRTVNYEQGDMTTHSGSLWIADADTDATPGSSGSWQRMLRADNRGGFIEGDGNG